MIDRVIDRGNVLPLAGVVVILLWLGGYFPTERQKGWAGVLAIIAFLLYTGYAFEKFRPRDAETVFGLAIRAVVVAGMVNGLTKLILPLLWGVWNFLRQQAEASAAAAREWADSQDRTRAQHERQLEEELRRRRAHAEREKADREGKTKAEVQAVIDKRRNDALASCEWLYHMHGPAIAARLPRSAFDDWIRNFMQPGADIDTLERRAIQLQNLILEHLRQVDPPESRLPVETERADARFEAMRYYRENAEFLRDVFPEPLLHSYLRLHLAQNLEPAKCWAACYQLIDQLRPMVSRERERRQKEAESQASLKKRWHDIDREIADFEREIDQMRGSPLDREVIEQEILNLRREIRKLEREKENLHSSAL